MMAESMETLEIEVKHKASGATDEIDKLTNSLLRLNRILAGTTIPKLEKLAEALGDIGKAKVIIDKATGKGGSSGKNKGVTTPFSDGQKDAIRNMEKQKVAWLKLAKRKDELDEALSNGDAGAAIDARDAVIKAQERFRKEAYNSKFTTVFSEAQRENIRNLEQYEIAWMKLAEAKEKLEHALNTGDSRGAIKAREEVLKAQEKYNQAYQDKFGIGEEEKKATVWERISRSLSKVTGQLKNVSKETANAAKHGKKAEGAFGKMLSSFKRIAMYRMLRKVLSEISKAAQEGLQNAYAFSQMIGSSISQTMDRLTSVSLTMKNQFGAALGELLTTIQPILEYIIQIATKIEDALAQFFAVLGGRSTYHKALDSTAKWVEQTEKGAEAAQEWKNQLMGFDEINRLEAPSDTGSGAGGAGNNIGNWALSPVSMDFSWLEKIKEFFSGLDLEPIKTALAGLKEAVIPLLQEIGEWINWIWENILAPFIQWIVEELAPRVINVITSIVEVVTALMEVIAPVLEDLWINILQPLFSWIGETVLSILDDLTSFLHDLAQLISGEITWDEFINGLSDSELFLGALVLGLTIGYGAFLLFNAVVGIASTVVGALSGALAFLAANPIVLVIAAIAAIIAIVILAIRHWDEWKQKLEEWKNKFSEFVGNGKLEWQDFVYFFIRIGESMMRAIENIVDGLKKVIEWCGKAIKKLREVLSKKSSADGGGTTISNGFSGSGGGSFASGGWPDEGQMFFARENGAGPEMVGTIGNRTAVATNNDIVAAIEGGVYRAMASAIGSGSRSGGTTVFNINGREFMRAIWDDRNAVIAEHGVSLVTNG